MATTTLMTAKNGSPFYRIRVHGAHGKSYSTRWYVPEGWSEKSIQKELRKVSAAFETACKAGQVQTRADKAAEAAQKAAEEARILTLRQYCQRVFMPTKAVTMAENSRAAYQGHLDRDILPVLGEMKMAEITSRQLTALLADYQRAGKAVASCVKCYTVLQGIFKMAFLDDTIPANPMAKVQRPKPRKEEAVAAEPESYTAEELRRIMDCLENEPLQWRAYVRLLIDSGMRRAEACGLQWQDIDFQAGRITVCRTLNYTPAAGIYADTTKNRKARSFGISREVLELLRALRQQQADTVLSKWVFTQPNSAEPIHPTSPTHYFRKFGQRYQVDGFHPHKLRHSFASVALTHGADIVSVSEKLGHSDTAVTLRVYAHANAESVEAASEIFREVLAK